MIRVNDDYVILVDALNYTPCRDNHKTDKEGKPTYKTIGYYSSLEGALRGIVKDMNVRAFEADTYSLQEAIKVIMQSNKVLTDMLMAVTDDRK